MQKNKQRALTRHHRFRTIARKAAIRKSRLLDNEALEEYGALGRLSKGKIHCSCNMCSRKRYVIGRPFSERKRYLTHRCVEEEYDYQRKDGKRQKRFFLKDEE